MAKYKLLKDYMANEVCGVLLKSDDPNHSGWGIPFDESNTDYQEYLAWVAEGNEPDPADEEE